MTEIESLQAENIKALTFQVKRLADRMAIMLLAHWAKSDTFSPYNNDAFWQSSDALELRTMPEYQIALELVRDLLRDPVRHCYLAGARNGEAKNAETGRR